MPRIGSDEWVAEVAGRSGAGDGVQARVRAAFGRVDRRWQFAIFFAIAAAFPFITSSEYLIRVAVNVLLYALLAIGLNVVVGWAGLLDLGYVAFYGFGAYGYAFVSSGQFDIHWPTLASIPAVVVASALLGLLVGLPSRRLVGDYLAIVTLFFLQIFVELTTNLDRINLPFTDRVLNLTGGPNGIPGVDPMSFFGIDLVQFQDYFFLLLFFLLVIVVALDRVDRSRIGRSWHAIREDPLAAELMTVPINRLKLMAFSLGAAVAGLTGTVFAAVQLGVFPQNFYVTLLIMIYAALILGGAGTMRGAIVGAIVIASVPEILRTPEDARWLFYIVVALALVMKIRDLRVLGAVVVATAAFGFALHAIVDAVWSTANVPAQGGTLAKAIDSWIVIPTEHRGTIGSYAFVALIAAVLGLVSLRGIGRLVLLVPTLYLAAFVWETKLVFQASVTRQLIFGALLVVLMAARPQGLLGKPRVEIV